MKQINKQKMPFILLALALVITSLLLVVVYFSVQHENQQMQCVTFSEDVFDGEQYVFSDFTAVIKPRGGDSGAWLKDPILDEAGNEEHGPSVGTIYELTLTNTSNAMITDWTMELHIPELMWLNNAWNGTMELHQYRGEDEIVQELDLKEYNDKDIILDHYFDHTGPMLTLNQGDYIVYHPSKAYSEFPLEPDDGSGETNSSALVGFIMYIPNQGLDYVTDFAEATINYHVHRSVFQMPVFILLMCLDLIWFILLIAFVISHFRIRKLLAQQKHDAMIIEQSISTFINFIEAKDPHTKGHSERVAKISYALAKEMGYSELECNRIYYVALMHDCGKISVPVTILQKPSRLTDEEYEVIKSHTVYGDKMLRDFNSIEGINLGALYHHERYDGTGYPQQLSGEDIPLIARIICVADSLDAMNSNRCYRPRLSKEVIMEELIKNKGKQFDPGVIECLIKLIKQNVIVIGEENNS